MPQQSFLQKRQTKFALYATVYTLIVIAVVGTLNFLANRYNKTYDATKNKKFTLSDQTEKIAKNLKQDVTITYWDKATNFTGAPVTLPMESAAPPRASPSSLVRMTPERPRRRWNSPAERTAS